MLKKALLASAVLAASTGLAFANGGTMPPAPHHTHNIYVGVGVSRDFVHFDTTQREWSNTVVNNAITSSVARGYHTADIGDDGWDAKLIAGIGWTFQDHYYLGAEIFGKISNADAGGSWVTYTGTPATVSKTQKKCFELDHSYGISLLPGVKISDSTMLYGRVSWIRSRFKVSDTLTSAVPTSSTAINIKKTKNGVQLGIGLETMVTNNVSARLEYDWARYGRISGRDTSADRTRTSSVSVKPTVNEAQLDVIYHFMSA